MKRLARWIIRGTLALAFVAFAVLWVRGYFASESIETIWVWATRDRAYFLTLFSGCGHLRMDLTEYHSRFPRPYRSVNYSRQDGVTNGDPGSRMEIQFWQFKFSTRELSTTFEGAPHRERYLGAWVPAWAPLAIVSVPVAIMAWRIEQRRRRSRSPTACKSCGYDLRAGHEKCPECGADSHVPASVDAPAAAAG